MAAVSSSSTEKRHRFRRSDISEQITGYTMILPALVIIGLFGLFPIGYAVYMSLFSWRVRQGPFIGLDNYTRAIGDWTGALLFVGGIALLVAAYVIWNNAFRSMSNGALIAKLLAAGVLVVGGVILSTGYGQMLEAGDRQFITSLVITVFYAIGSVPLQIGLALFLAYILFQKLRGREMFRIIYFLPYIIPVVTMAVVFRTIFSPRETALANQILGIFGIAPLRWLHEPAPAMQVLFGWAPEGLWAGPSLALVSIILFGIWNFVGFAIVIFLAGLSNIPGSLYEAAEIDGANGWQSFRHITLPLLSPVTFYLLLITFIGTFKAFNTIYVMRTPSAQGTVDVTSIVIFDTFFAQNNYSFATAQAIILFVIILALTLIQNQILGRKVFYG